jgi:hypothetical protein
MHGTQKALLTLYLHAEKYVPVVCELRIQRKIYRHFQYAAQHTAFFFTDICKYRVIQRAKSRHCILHEKNNIHMIYACNEV